MSQLPLFAPAPTAPRPADPAFVRKHLGRLLRLVQRAQHMPWGAAEADKWERLFPQLTNGLPTKEAGQLRNAFATEIARLRAAD